MAKQKGVNMHSLFFLVALLTAVIISFFQVGVWGAALVWVLGIVVGLINITIKESLKAILVFGFLALAGTAGAAAALAGPILAQWLTPLLINIFSFFAIIGYAYLTKCVYLMAKDK